MTGGIARRIRHRTTYAYDQPVDRAHHQGWLLPRPHPGQTVISAELSVDPPPLRLVHETDWFGNRTTRFELAGRHRRLVVEAVIDVIRADPPPLDLVPAPLWRAVAAELALPSAPIEAVEFRHASPLVPILPEAGRFAGPSFAENRPLPAALRDLIHRIRETFAFDATATTVATPLAEVFQRRRGVCQDFAHVAIACVRAMGLAARYHSGYIETLPPPGKPRLVGADASHAWLAVWCPGLGWIEADPTNDLMPVPHVTLGWGRDFADVTPLKGVILGGGTQRLTVAVDVVRVDQGEGDWWTPQT